MLPALGELSRGEMTSNQGLRTGHGQVRMWPAVQEREGSAQCLIWNGSGGQPPRAGAHDVAGSSSETGQLLSPLCSALAAQRC